MSIVPHDGRRTVYLPLKELDKCAACGKTTSLRLCSSCGERIYCSPECQKGDWPTHKSICGKTDRIDLTTFYPFLALLAESHRLHPDKPLHPALTHAILNSPNPTTLPTAFPDGTSAKLVILGEPVPQEQYASHRWWPTAASDFVRHKLFRRIGHEGYLVPVLTAVCVALLAEMYTTTYIPPSPSSSPSYPTPTPTQRRTRLQYRSSPIADFGIATGPASVTPGDRLAYLNLSDDTFECGADPSTHAWLYFTTVRGEEFALDLGGMFLFNLCFAVPADPYGQGMLAPVRYAPAYFRDRAQARGTPVEIMRVERRYSVLRDEGLGEAVRWSGRKGGVAFEGEDVRRVVEFMERVGGGGGRGKVSDVEMDLTMKWCVNGCVALGITMADRAWVKWPKEPMLAIETDPGEMDEEEEEEGKGVSEEWFKYVRRWNKKYKKGQISKEVLGDMYRAWAKRQARAQGREKEKEKEP
ncbi:hypothetical protein Hypma_016376 [Hypsizygus marmoreus]|uniref:MYND-type domain-containing protein n=1 Tax=Hypsizygus marmoreus TaxID=39966 RepID=A0A369J4J7_HYPMA|nr:hypothetical protein Hypma_016376 [Hypsizygus marmoreus]